MYGKAAIDAYLIDVAQGKGRTSKTVFTGRYIKLVADADIHGVKDDEWAPEIIEVDEFSGGRLIQALKSVLSSNLIHSINLFGRVYSIEEVVGGFLREMKERADRVLGKDIRNVVLGRPVHYVGGNNEYAIERMRKAAAIGGFENVEFEYEPIAAAYDFGSRVQSETIVLIFDFGGGTLDISIMKFPEKKVLANVGLPIGGDFFNSRIFQKKLAPYFGSNTSYGINQIAIPNYIYNNLRDWYRATLLKTENFNEDILHFKMLNSDPKTIDALASLVNNNLSFSLYDEIDRAKIGLTKNESEIIQFQADRIDIHEIITRDDFEEYIFGDLIRIEELINQALSDAEINSGQIDKIATTGGSSLIPIVRRLLERKFDRGKIIESDAFTSVASGLALKAHEVYT